MRKQGHNILKIGRGPRVRLSEIVRQGDHLLTQGELSEAGRLIVAAAVAEILSQRGMNYEK